MKKKIKFFSYLLIATCCFVLGVTDVGATTIQPRAIRYNFDVTLTSTKPTWYELQYPADGDNSSQQGLRYIRVRFEPGTVGKGNITVQAIGYYTYTSPTLASVTVPVERFDKGGIIDFKAKNAPARADATYTVDCVQPKNYPVQIVTDDYCVAMASAWYGIRFSNATSGSPRLYGGYSFEN